MYHAKEDVSKFLGGRPVVYPRRDVLQQFLIQRQDEMNVREHRFNLFDVEFWVGHRHCYQGSFVILRSVSISFCKKI